MRVRNRLAHSEDGRDAGIGAIKNRCPLISGFGLEYRGHFFTHGRPLLAIHLLRQRVDINPHLFHEHAVELRLYRADTHMLAIARLKRPIEVSAAVESIGFSFSFQVP